MARHPRLRNMRMERPGRRFRQAISGDELVVPSGREPRASIALALNVPQKFVVLLNDSEFVVQVPIDLDWLDDDGDECCTICGDVPSQGQPPLLDRDMPADAAQTCQRCLWEKLCAPCRVELPGPQGGTIACLACLEPEEASGLADKRRSEALEAYWTGRDELEKATHPSML